MAAAAGKCRLDTRRDGLLHARHVRGRVADQMAVWGQAQAEMHHNSGMRHASSPSQERTRTGLENRLSMLPARSRPADAPVKAKALYRARVGSVGVATPCIARPPRIDRQYRRAWPQLGPDTLSGQARTPPLPGLYDTPGAAPRPPPGTFPQRSRSVAGSALLCCEKVTATGGFLAGHPPRAQGAAKNGLLAADGHRAHRRCCRSQI